jgi:hypothetical protein
VGEEFEEMALSRRKFLALLGATAGAHALPASVVGLKTPPAGVAKNVLHQAIGRDAFAKLGPEAMSEVGDMIFLSGGHVWLFKRTGELVRLSSQFNIEQRNPLYWHSPSAAWPGLERHR